MTSVVYAHGGGRFVLTCEGHAAFAPSGQDIVCAGISALCGALEIALDNLQNTGRAQSHFCSSAEAYFQACADAATDSDAVRTAFDTVYDGLCRIEEVYPAYLQCCRTTLKKEDTK